MKLKQHKTLISPKVGVEDFRSKVTALCYTRDGAFLGVATSDRIISIYDESGNRVERLNTKPNNKGPKDYIIRSIQFGPDIDNPKLAVGQTDKIVFVYKWSPTDTSKDVWSGRKSICNKFPETSPIVSILWPKINPNQFIYALMEGKIKVGSLRSNKAQVLYSIESCAISLAMNKNGNELLSGHSDGSIYKFTFPTRTSKPTCSKLVSCPQPPRILLWGRSICTGRSESVLTFYDENGKEEQILEESLSTDTPVQSHNLTVACASPNGESIIVGAFDEFSLCTWDSVEQCWSTKITRSVKNMLNVSALAWKPNGSSVVVGTSAGLLDLYNANYRNFVYKGVYEITFVSPTEVLVHDKDTPNSSPLVLHSSYGNIIKIDIFPKTGEHELRYLIGRTQNTLLLCDLRSSSASVSEIEWKDVGTQEVKFFFDDPNACIVCHAGELSIIEYGSTGILGTVRTEHHSPHLTSLRFLRNESTQDIIRKEIAYLLDKQTISVTKLHQGSSFNIYHDVSIDFLEISPRGNHTVFRDKKRNLIIFDNVMKKKSHILNFCGYVQWVPGTDVLVAQHKQAMHVWYNINDPNQVTLREVKGEIVDIERHNGKSEVIVKADDDPSFESAYLLSEACIHFTEALNVKDYAFCAKLLDKIEPSVEQKAMWNQLLDASLKNCNLPILERCASALQNASLARFIRSISEPLDLSNAKNWKTRAKLCELSRDFDEAENIYLANNGKEEVIKMYENLEMFSDAIRVMSKVKDPNIEEKRERYLKMLIKSNSQDKAAVIKESEGDIAGAITLYLQGGFVERAADLCIRNGIVEPLHLLREVALALETIELYENCGDMYTTINLHKEALSCYTKGGISLKAAAAAEKCATKQVKTLEQKR